MSDLAASKISVGSLARSSDFSQKTSVAERPIVSMVDLRFSLVAVRLVSTVMVDLTEALSSTTSSSTCWFSTKLDLARGRRPRRTAVCATVCATSASCSRARANIIKNNDCERMRAATNQRVAVWLLLYSDDNVLNSL